MPSVDPARIIRNGIQADPLDRDASLNRGTDFASNVAQPGSPGLGLRTGLGHKDWPLVASVDLSQNLTERAVQGMAQLNGPTAEEPLVIRIIVDAQDVQILRLAAEPWPQPACQHVPRLKLGAAIRLGRLPVARMIGAGDDVNDRIHLHDPRLRVHAPDRLDGGDRRTHELLLQFVATPPDPWVKPGDF